MIRLCLTGGLNKRAVSYTPRFCLFPFSFCLGLIIRLLCGCVNKPQDVRIHKVVFWNFLQIPRTGGTIAIHSQEKKYTETSVGSKINREFGKWTA
ncbi:uncharacterized protein LOC143224973 isoform X1 [Tachypleus tridentatus]|uniref:uncharacterized protein LOC143224973 isoform X1 n=1 Tax=Tachypleus tridentatus TaxID=6853 RepID=UPI003FD59341